MYNILVIEDEENIRNLIALNLSLSDFNVLEAGSAEKGYEILKENDIDMIILDIMLPGMDGYEFCEKIRNEGYETPLIMLTAKSQDLDKITGLDLGADDYMLKPFNPSELISRIKAIFRRVKKSEKCSTVIRGTLKIDKNSKKFYKKEEEIPLTNKEFVLMELFMNNPGKAFSRDEIMDLCWGENFFGDSKTVDVHVRRLREKLGEECEESTWIETVWGVGYRFKEF